jgi:uncharacterized protein (TIGR02231 family)
MRPLLFTAAIIFLLAATVSAETKQKLNIEHATVFLNGAELTGSAKISLPTGESEIIFTNVAGNINQQSISVGADNNVAVQSVTFQNNYLGNDNLTPKAQALKDSLELLQKARQNLSNKIAVIDEQMEILAANRQIAGANTGLSVAELQKMLDLVKVKRTALLEEQTMFNESIRKTDERSAKLQRQFEEEQKRNVQPGGQIMVKFYSERPVSSNIAISYVTPNAGWSPTYDIRVNKLNGPVNLFYKANVYQNSGIKWDNIRISLSTGNPNEGAQSPTMNPWYLAFYQPRPVSYSSKALTSEEISKMPTRNTQQSIPSMSGGRSDASQYIVDGVQVQNAPPPMPTLNSYVQVDNSGVATSFDIDIPYTIPSDGQQHLVSIKGYELPATYRYYAVPKLDKDVFLQAQVTNWEQLDLLPGATNIFYEGTYVGRGYIDMRNTKDTMNISLGRDKKIIIKRERDKELRNVKTIGTNVRESFVYTIDIRNTRKESAELIIVDQFPVSNDKDIVIEDKDNGSAEYDENNGELKWKIKLNAGENKKLRFGYTVKYPKGRSINL